MVTEEVDEGGIEDEEAVGAEVLVHGVVDQHAVDDLLVGGRLGVILLALHTITILVK